MDQETVLDMNSTDMTNTTIGGDLDDSQIGKATVIGVLCLLLVLAAVIICVLGGIIYMAKSMMMHKRCRDESLMSNAAYMSNRHSQGSSVKSTLTNRLLSEERNDSLINNAAYIPRVHGQTEESTPYTVTISEEPYYSEVRQHVFYRVPQPSKGRSMSCYPIFLMQNEAYTTVLGDGLDESSASYRLSIGNNGNDYEQEQRPQEMHAQNRKKRHTL